MTVTALAVFAVLLAGSAGPAPAGMNVAQTFTNTTGGAAQDFHWPFNPSTLTINGINGGAFSVTGTTLQSELNQIRIDCSGGVVNNQAQNTVTVTVGENSAGQGTAWWSGAGGAYIGDAGTPISLRGNPGTTATEWIVAFDNRDIGTLRLIVNGLKSATTSTIYNADNFAGAAFEWNQYYNTMMIDPGAEVEMTIAVPAGQYPVFEGEIWDEGLYDQTHSTFRVQFTPEPATMCLLGLGAVGVLMRGRKKK
jgi:hypothetical protein